jgi:hypothetical protein
VTDKLNHQREREREREGGRERNPFSFLLVNGLQNFPIFLECSWFREEVVVVHKQLHIRSSYTVVTITIHYGGTNCFVNEALLIVLLFVSLKSVSSFEDIVSK